MSKRLTLTQIQTALLIPVTGAFIEGKLGIEPVERAKRAVFWKEEDYQTICQKLIAHIGAARDIDISKVNGERPKKEKEAAEQKPTAADDDFFAESAAPASGGGDDFFGDSSAPASETGGDDFFGEAESKPAEEDFFA